MRQLYSHASDTDTTSSMKLPPTNWVKETYASWYKLPDSITYSWHSCLTWTYLKSLKNSLQQSSTPLSRSVNVFHCITYSLCSITTEKYGRQSKDAAKHSIQPKNRQISMIFKRRQGSSAGYPNQTDALALRIGAMYTWTNHTSTLRWQKYLSCEYS